MGSLKAIGEGLKTFAPVLGAGFDALSGIFGSSFNAREARKNREFQREMYDRQLQDNIRIWNMMNRYDLPSAQVQRLREANLNPYLMYSNGASGVTAANTLSGASAPSGAQASSDMRTQFGQAAYQAALMRAQIANINADTEQKQASAKQSEATTGNLEYDLLFKKLTQNIDIALKHGNLDNLNTNTQLLGSQILNTNEMTFQNALTMRQARLYEIKRFDLDRDTIGVQLQQGWKSIANDTQRVKQGWRSLALQWLKIQSDIHLNNAQIGALQWQVLSDKAMWTERFRGLKLDNQLKVWDTHLKRVGVTEGMVKTFNGMLKNYYLLNLGTESVGNYDIPRTLWQSTNKPSLQDLLIVPQIKK